MKPSSPSSPSGSPPPTEAELRPILTDFYGRVFADLMIGFFFEGKDKQRLIDKEIELALVMFGAAEQTYTGRPLRQAHAPHPIMGGHFARRTQILADTLATHGFAADLTKQWLEHTESLRPLITDHQGGDCD